MALRLGSGLLDLAPALEGAAQGDEVGVLEVGAHRNAARDARFLLLGGISQTTSQREAERLLREADVLVDFSRPPATLRFAPQAARAVICTTGFSPAQLKRLKRFSRRKDQSV